MFFSALYLVHPSSILFYSSSIPYSVSSLCLFTFFSDLPYCFLFKSVILYFLFSCYSNLSASPLCSITIQSVLFLLVFIFLDPTIIMTLPVLCSVLSFSLFSFPLSLFVLFMLSFCFCFYSFSFSVLFFPLFYMLLLFLLLTCYYFFLFLPPLSLFFSFIFIYYSFIYFFVYLFNYLFIHYYYYYYFLSSLFRLYRITTSAHWLGVLSLILYTVSAV